MVAREIARIVAIVSLIIALAAIVVALMVLVGIAVNWLATVAKAALAWLVAHDRAAGALVAAAIVLVIVTLHER